MLVTLDNLGQWGVLRDGLPHELPDNAFSDGRNVRFREGYAEKFLGHTAAYGDSVIQPYHVAPLAVGSTQYWVEAGLNAIYSIDANGTHSVITPSSAPTGAIDDYWTSTWFSGILVLNNGKDKPVTWNGTGLCADLANWPSTLRAKSVRAFRQFLVAVNVSKDSGANWYPHMVKWSHSADPGTLPDSWDETDPTKDAGEADLADHPSPLVDALPLGDSLIVYKEGAYYWVRDTGDNSIFRAQMVSSEAGMLARNCAAAFPGGHVVLGQGDLFVHNGGAPETILTARARRWLFSNLDGTNFGRSFLVANPLANEVWCCFPSIGQETCNLALVWNHKANTLGIRELPGITHANGGVVDADLADSWDSEDEPWATWDIPWNQSATTKNATRLVMAGSDLLLADQGSGFSSVPFTAYIERTGLSLGAPDRMKLCRGVRPIFEGSEGGSVTIEIGASNEPNTEPTWSAPVTFNIGSDFKADSFAQGRYLAYRIKSDSLVNWRIKRLALDVVEKGAY